VAERLAREQGLSLLMDATVAPGVVAVYRSVAGHVDAVHVHPDAGAYDVARNAGAGWSNHQPARDREDALLRLPSPIRDGNLFSREQGPRAARDSQAPTTVGVGSGTMNPLR
jgi:hypothetical protein